jgi:lactoylglutathione lyase
MADRSFPVVYASDVAATARFFERLGFERHVQMPPDGEPGYVGLRRASGEVAVVDGAWPQDQFGVPMGDGPRVEMFVYVDDVDVTVADLTADGTTVLRPATDMPWGERVAYVTDPDGNPVALAAPLPT